MEFEFDPAKSASNRDKHGIDFVEAQTLWDDPRGRELEIDRSGEDRRLWIAGPMGRIWTAVFTYRTGRARIISVRRSRPKEVAYYERR